MSTGSPQRRSSTPRKAEAAPSARTNVVDLATARFRRDLRRIRTNGGGGAA
jgi:hypothetical protein